MPHAGYSWTIREQPDAWVWSLLPPGGGPPILQGTAPSRAVAAALVIRAISRGVTARPIENETLAA
jgi:hypothetical protein